MELTTQEMPVEYLRRSLMDTAYQELTAEVIVPDSLPDMERIVDAFGTVIVQEKRCADGELRLSGGIQAGVLYVPEGESTPQTLEAWLPFSLRKAAETDTACMIEQAWIKSIDARMLSERKALLRVNLGISLMQFSPETVPLTTVKDAPEMLQQRQNTYPVLLPVACGEQEFRIQDELTLPETGPAIDRILKWELRPTVEESRMIGSKAVFKGDVVIDVLYLGTDGSINTFVGQIPYSQYAEMSDEWPDGSVAVFPAVTAAQIETDGQMESRMMLVDLSLLAQVCVIDQIELTLTEDAYAIGATLAPVWQKIKLDPLLDTQTLQPSTELTVPAQASKIVDVSVFADQPQLRRTQDTLYASAGLTGTVLYFDTNGMLRAKSLRGESVCSASVHADCRCTPVCRLTQRASAAVQPDSICVRVPLEFTLEFYQEGAWQNLAGGTITETEQAAHPSVIIRRWQSGDLWPLAKQLGAAVSDIEAANPAENGREILLIPLRSN